MEICQKEERETKNGSELHCKNALALSAFQPLQLWADKTQTKSIDLAYIKHQSLIVECFDCWKPDWVNAFNAAEGFSKSVLTGKFIGTQIKSYRSCKKKILFVLCFPWQSTVFESGFVI